MHGDPLLRAAGVALVGPEVAEGGKRLLYIVEDQRRSPVLEICGMDRCAQDQSEHVDQQVALTARKLLGSIVSTQPPMLVVFTDWLSMMLAVGCACRPCRRRS